MQVHIRQAIPDDLDGIFQLNFQINSLHFANAPEAFVAPSEADREFPVSYTHLTLPTKRIV